MTGGTPPARLFPNPETPDPETSMTRKIEKTDAEWRAQLSPEEYQVTRQKGTERAYTGRYWDCHEAGQYKCTCCGAELFSSEHK